MGEEQIGEEFIEHASYAVHIAGAKA